MKKLFKLFSILILSLFLVSCKKKNKETKIETTIPTIIPTTKVEPLPSPSESESIEIPSYYVLATDNDFSGNEDGLFVYVGYEDYVIVPEYIKGVKVTKTSNLDYEEKYTIGNIRIYMFMERPNIKGVVFENPKNVTNMSGLFYNNSSLELELLYLDTKNVIDMHLMFGSTSAKSFDLSNFDTRNVLIFDSMFFNSLASNINVSSFDTSKVTNMSGMFRFNQYEELIITSFNTSNVENMDNMFYLLKVEELDLSSFEITSLESYINMFEGASFTKAYAKDEVTRDFFNNIIENEIFEIK